MLVHHGTRSAEHSETPLPGRGTLEHRHVQVLLDVLQLEPVR